MFKVNKDYLYEKMGVSENVLNYWISIPKHFPTTDYLFLYQYYYIE